MTQLLTCPLCRFSKEVPADKLPRKPATVTCPKCRQSFTYSPPADPAAPPAAAVDRGTPAPVIADNIQVSLPQPRATIAAVASTRPKSWASMDLKNLSTRQKSAAAAFILVVLSLVFLRIWADGKARDIPFPNMVAARAEQVAISYGKSIVICDQAGKCSSTIEMPRDTEITHLAYDSEGNLWLGDHRTKQIFRLQNGQWVAVINGVGTIRGTFKFVQYPPTGEIFVTDSSNHRIHAYSAEGRLLRSFAKEGKGEGELMFPNDILLVDGDLLVVNTNAGRLDLFSREGKFLRTFCQTEKAGCYRFPTLMTWLDGGDFAYLLTADLFRAKVIVRDGGGKPKGEFVTPLPLKEVGDIAFAGGRAIITDIGNRQIYTFDPASFAYKGVFSPELAKRADLERRKEAGFKAIGWGALFLLLAVCLWTGIALFRSQQQVETADIEAVACEGELQTAVAATAAAAATLPVAGQPVGVSRLPVFLSALYPGLGQFYNRQISKGSVLAVIFTLEALALTGPTIKLIERSAELRKQDIPILATLCLALFLTWLVAVVDARSTARKRR